jgi:hypothetical protein
VTREVTDAMIKAFEQAACRPVGRDSLAGIAAALAAERVEITDAIIGAAGSQANDLIHRQGDLPEPNERWRLILAAAFRAAGFEVSQ